jgi:hypothetical protein
VQGLRSTFAGDPVSVTARQRKPHKNRDIFTLIVNRVPISRILETVGIGVDTFYRKLRFIHEQCHAFAGQRERRLWEGRVRLPAMSLATDRQHYREAIVESAKRKKARAEARTKARGKVGDKMDLDVGLEYVDAMSRDDIERSDMKDETIGLPRFGVQIHEQYVMHAHFMLLEKLLRAAPAVRLCMDQDSGFLAAALTAFGQRIKARTTDVFYVEVEKSASAYEKKKAVADAQRALEAFMTRSGIADTRRALIELLPCGSGSPRDRLTRTPSCTLPSSTVSNRPTTVVERVCLMVRLVASQFQEPLLELVE